MKKALSNAVLTELPQRLYDAAEAFYYAAILTCLKFNASNIHARYYGNATEAANAALADSRKNNDLGAPPIANFCFAIELYIKLLGALAGTPLKNGHNLQKLFCELDKVAPGIGSSVIKNHHYWSDDPASFLECIKKQAAGFEKWRYAYEEEFLCASPDELLALANAFRATVSELHPDFHSAFHKGPTPD